MPETRLTLGPSARLALTQPQGAGGVLVLGPGRPVGGSVLLNLAGALRGEKGDAGAAVSYVCAASIGGHVAVVLNAAGQCLAADAATATHFAVAGITTQAAIAGDAVVLVRDGTLEHLGWTFTPGLPVFLGLGGALVQSVPGSAVFSKVLGVAVAATRIAIDFQPAIFI